MTLGEILLYAVCAWFGACFVLLVVLAILCKFTPDEPLTLDKLEHEVLNGELSAESYFWMLEQIENGSEAQHQDEALS